MMHTYLKKISILSTCLTFGLLQAACASSAPIGFDTANSVTANIAAQAITPPAEQKANTHIPADVTLRDAARERYRMGKVTPPVAQSTQ